MPDTGMGRRRPEVRPQVLLVERPWRLKPPGLAACVVQQVEIDESIVRTEAGSQTAVESCFELQ